MAVLTYVLPLGAGATRLSDVYGGVASTPATQAYQQRVLADGALAYWPFDDPAGSLTVRDRAGTRTGTIVGDVTPGVLGLGGARAAAFAGGWMTAPNLPAAAPAFSIECWARAEAPLGFMVTRSNLNDNNAGGVWELGLYQRFPGPQPQTFMFGWVEVAGAAAPPDVFSAPNMPLQVWHHVVGTHDGTTAQLYVAGVAVAGLTSSLAADTQLGNHRLVIGGYGLAGGSVQYTWTGQLADVAYYPRALTAAEIAAHYTLRQAASPSPSTLLAEVDLAYRQLLITADPDNPGPIVIGDSAVTVGGEGIVLAPPAGGALLAAEAADGPALLAAFPTTGLVSYWSFDAGWNDQVGTNHLTNVGGVTAVAGKLGQAGDFEASSAQYLSYTDSTPLGDEDFAFILWFKRETIGVRQQLIAKDDTTGRSFYLLIDNTLIRWFFGSDEVAVGHPTSVADTTWHFLVAWHDAGANTLHLQLDNGSVASAGTGGIFPPNVALPVFIGARQYAGFQEYFDGLIDEVGLWRRVLTAQERTDLWNGGAGLALPAGPAGGAASALTLGPFDTGPVKLSHLYAAGTGALRILGVPY